LQYFISTCIYLLFRFIYGTCRIETLGSHHRLAALESSALNSCVLVFWHEHLVSTISAHLGQKKISTMASRSSSGRMIGRSLIWLGFMVEYGSQKRNGKEKGGKEARDGLLAHLKSGHIAALTVDGSIGPRRFCKPGAIHLAKLSGTSIVPCATVVSRYWQLNTWDKLQIPKPFSRIILNFGPPLSVQQNLEEPEYLDLQILINEKINSVENEALKYLDQRYGIRVSPDLR